MSKKNRRQRNQLQQGATLAPGRRTEVTLMSASFFQGPLPPAEELSRYEQIMPGMTDRLVRLHERTFDLAREQSEHRRGLEKHVIEENTSGQRRGQWMAFAIVIFTVAVGAGLIYMGKRTEGLWAMFGPLAGVLGIFVVARSRQDKELERRRRELESTVNTPPAN